MSVHKQHLYDMILTVEQSTGKVIPCREHFSVQGSLKVF